MENFLETYEPLTMPYIDYFGIEKFTEDEINYWNDYMIEITPIKSEISLTGNAVSIRYFLKDRNSTQN